MKKKRIRRQRMIPLRHVFVASIIMFIFFTLFGLWFINIKVSPVLTSIATAKTKQIAAYAIIAGVNKELTQEWAEYNTKEGGKQLYTFTYDKDNYITGVNYNMAVVTRIYSEATQKIQQYLRSIEDGTNNPVNTDINDTEIEGGEKGVIAKIPLGQATENVLFSNLGPTIPVRLAVTSNVQPNIQNQVKELNINSALVEIYLDVIVEVQVVLPFQTEMVRIPTKIPVAIQYIQGPVPYYYSGGKDNTSLALPQTKVDEEQYEQQRSSNSNSNSNSNQKSSSN